MKNDSDRHALDFVLVKSVRTAAGPRQKIVGYLGSIEERLLKSGRVPAFYGQALPRLRTLAGDHYDRLLEALKKMVPSREPSRAIKPPEVKDDFKVW